MCPNVAQIAVPNCESSQQMVPCSGCVSAATSVEVRLHSEMKCVETVLKPTRTRTDGTSCGSGNKCLVFPVAIETLQRGKLQDIDVWEAIVMAASMSLVSDLAQKDLDPPQSLDRSFQFR